MNTSTMPLMAKRTAPPCSFKRRDHFAMLRHQVAPLRPPPRPGRCSGGTLLEFVLSAPGPSPGEVRRVLAQQRIDWGLPRRRNFLILACERGLDTAVLDALLQAFYRQRRLALLDGTRRFFVADREALTWAAAHPEAAAGRFLLDLVQLQPPSLCLEVLLGAVQSGDQRWAVHVLLHSRIRPIVALVALPDRPIQAKSTKSSSRRRLGKRQQQQLAVSCFLESVRLAASSQMDALLRQLDAVNPRLTRAAAAYCHSHQPTQSDSSTLLALAKEFRADLLWQQVGPLVLARMEKVRPPQSLGWALLLGCWSRPPSRSMLLLPGSVFRLIVAFVSVESEAATTLALLAQYDDEGR